MSDSKNLVIIAHPDINNSRVNKALLNSIKDLPNITIHQLYLKYPDFKINVDAEQKLLLETKNIVMQFPLYWYHTPPLLKLWLDSVFTRGFSHGPQGLKLKDKKLQIVTTTARSEKHYKPDLWIEEDFDKLAKNTKDGTEGITKQDQPYMKPSLVEKYGLNILEAIFTPLEQTTYHAHMIWEKPFVVHSAMPKGSTFYALTDEELKKKCQVYVDLIKKL